MTERRIHPERRVALPECAIDWAFYQITEGHRSRRDVAAQLQINRRTLDRRLEDRPTTELRIRCPICQATASKPLCPNGHPVELFYRKPLTARRPSR